MLLSSLSKYIPKDTISLALVLEEDVVDSFNRIMTDFLASALNVAKYFEQT